MGAISRLRYVIAANVNALIEKAEDPEKLLRALIREMEDASEEARLACADLLAEQQRLERLEARLESDLDQWHQRAEKAVADGRDELAREALKTKAEIAGHRQATADERRRLDERVTQMEQDMATLKAKLADAKAKLKELMATGPAQGPARREAEHLSPGERKVRRAMGRFDRLQAQVDSLEARVRSYEVGGASAPVWNAPEAPDPAVEEELAQLKKKLSAEAPDASAQSAGQEA
jgi:phage shock protein A